MSIVDREFKQGDSAQVRLRVRRWLGVVVLSIAGGWATMISLTYLAERPLLLLTAPLVGAHWVATARLMLDCLKLAATGWAIGRLHRSAPLPGVLAFAATLGLFNLEAWLPLDFSGLIRLAIDAAQDARYWGPLVDTGAQHLLLMVSLIAGGLLSRQPQTPFSLLGRTPR